MIIGPVFGVAVPVGVGTGTGVNAGVAVASGGITSCWGPVAGRGGAGATGPVPVGDGAGDGVGVGSLSTWATCTGRVASASRAHEPFNSLSALAWSITGKPCGAAVDVSAIAGETAFAIKPSVRRATTKRFIDQRSSRKISKPAPAAIKMFGNHAAT